MGAREYCREELRRKLEDRGFEARQVRSVVRRLVEMGYLSDARFAEAFLRSRMRRGETPLLAAMKARRHGVSEAALSAAYEAACGQFDAEEACRALLARRDPASRYVYDERERVRQVRFLRNKGFDTATILRVMNERRADMPE
ncbi:MAG: regulatory protein RecX [Zetaproteobacteria bacterium]|nr:MAG: regulatory protein RecX [Zetaproteobacteria bacterium]